MHGAVPGVKGAHRKRVMRIEPRHDYNTSAMGQKRNRPLEIRRGSGVPVNVDSVRRELRDRFDDIVGLIIDHAACAQGPAMLDVSIAARSDDQAGAYVGCQLQYSRTDVAGASVYEYCFAGT